MHRLNPSAKFGSFFFQPLDFHLQSAYLLEELLVARPVLGYSFTASVLEQRRRAFQELLLPGRDLVSVNLILGRQLGCGLIPRHAASATFALNPPLKLRRFRAILRTS